jgi:hypothetical protein
MGEVCNFGNCSSTQPPQRCMINSDCPMGQLCVGGVCQSGVQCQTDRDCSFPEICRGNQCVQP